MTDASGESFLSPIIAQSYLSHAAPEAVYAWLKANADEIGLFSTFPDELLRALLERHDPIINLGIASVAAEPEILRPLWKSGDPAVRSAIAGNKHREQGIAGIFNRHSWAEQDDLTAALQDDRGDFVKLWCTNPALDFSGLTDAFAREGIYEKLSDERWLAVIYWALQNPKLTVRDDRSYEGTDYPAYRAAWGLLLTLPTTRANANVLCGRYSKLKTFDADYNTVFEKPASILTDRKGWQEQQREGKILFLRRVFERWSANASNDPDARDKDGNETYQFQMLRQDVAAAVAKRLGNDVHNFLKNHEDAYVRRGYTRGAPTAYFPHLSSDEDDELWQADEPAQFGSSKSRRIARYVARWAWRVARNAFYALVVWYVLSQLHGRPENIIVPVLGLIYVALRTGGISVGQITLQQGLALDAIYEKLKSMADASHTRPQSEAEAIEQLKFRLTGDMIIESLGLSAISFICLWFLFITL